MVLIREDECIFSLEITLQEIWSLTTTILASTKKLIDNCLSKTTFDSRC
jgi:hypothetical protein